MSVAVETPPSYEDLYKRNEPTSSRNAASLPARRPSVDSVSSVESLRAAPRSNDPLLGTRSQTGSLRSVASQRYGSSPTSIVEEESATPVEDQIPFKQHRPYFLTLVTVAQVALLIYSLVYNKQHFGEFIEKDPFNPMVGPTTTTLVQLGAKYTPCIVPTAYFDNTRCPDEYKDLYPPVNVRLDDGTLIACGDLEQYCGFGGFKQAGQPDQWWRIITPIFLHTGIVHLLLNLVFQIRTGIPLERDIGSFRMAIIYMSSGIFGFLLASNFSIQIPSVGCSGSLFGLLAVILIDLLLHWRAIQSPWCEFFKIFFVALFSLSLGLLPFFDNFAHLGGFVMGLLSGLVFLPRVHFSKWDRRRKIFLTLASIPVLLTLFVLLFYRLYAVGVNDYCEWCGYLNCLPIPLLEAWCYD